jgi:hypothetical protein
MTTAEKLTEREHPDFIFFDLPGMLNTVGVIKTLASMPTRVNKGNRR